MKNSLTYRRVDKAIITAFIQLSDHIPFEKLTVQDILEEALISRYTFYSHFHDKYEVAERLQADMYQEFQVYMQERIPQIDACAMPTEAHHQLIDAAIIEFTRKHHAQMRAIKNIHTETIDYLRLIKNYFIENYRKNAPEHPNMELEAEIYANMATAVMEYFDSDTAIRPNISAPTMEAYINAALYAIGVHDEKRQKKARDYLTVLALTESQV